MKTISLLTLKIVVLSLYFGNTPVFAWPRLQKLLVRPSSLRLPSPHLSARAVQLAQKSYSQRCRENQDSGSELLLPATGLVLAASIAAALYSAHESFHPHLEWLSTEEGKAFLNTEEGSSWLWRTVFSSSHPIPVSKDTSLPSYELDKESIQILRNSKKLTLKKLEDVCQSKIGPEYIDKRYSNLNSENMNMIATFKDEEIAGFVIFENKKSRFSSDPVKSSHIYLICSNLPRSGLGTQLLTAVENQKAGIPTQITLDTLDKNKNLVDFYKKSGYSREPSLFETLLKHTHRYKKVLKSSGTR